ncbi:hypothetical protein [Nocardiopsis sp. NPDC006938]|uniref:hypothetical protein n=1 Tax=Nocardiopsis sp. NPDC006938 TaxID=3364337 RepID=UPI0036850462
MRSLTLITVATATAGLLATGCGVLGEGDAADSEASSEKTMEEAMLDYAACMRDAGFDMPDPDPDGGMIALPALEEPDDEMLAAMEECDALLPVDEDPLTDEERFEADLRIAECLREHGIDIEDPERGMGLAIPIDPDDDEHMAAVSACTGADDAESGGVVELEAEGDS